ncbi:hypothetical protein BaRGS_00014983 [Batillaria attramentaria]|uniref:Uncharacterized protein n=1 Tax=Batillaria attramentaria TaxID=370345 RepID=A0ABD0L487_9CAEN
MSLNAPRTRKANGGVCVCGEEEMRPRVQYLGIRLAQTFQRSKQASNPGRAHEACRGSAKLNWRGSAQVFFVNILEN